MNENYHRRLLEKLKRAMKRTFRKHTTTITLSKYEIQDLGILWEEEAKKRWSRANE